MEEGRYRPSEYYSLLLLATTGMMLMVSGFTLLSIWISLELMALSSYILAGYFKREKKSNEAALKYFILGALSSGILLYGISLLYGATGTIQLAELAAQLPGAQAANGMLVTLGWIFLAAGLLFKVAAVPFHVWTPDVYVGAPTPVTAYLAAASKAAAFAILVRIFYMGLTPLVLDWQPLVASVAVLSMVWGNLAALTQQNVKRMLAYSSIAHAGYILIGVLAVSEIGLWALMFYVLAYTVITLGAFGTVVLLERREYAGETYADYAGLAQRAPLLAAMMLIFLLGLTGIPPTGGFFGQVLPLRRRGGERLDLGSGDRCDHERDLALLLHGRRGLHVLSGFRKNDARTPTSTDARRCHRFLRPGHRAAGDPAWPLCRAREGEFPTPTLTPARHGLLDYWHGLCVGFLETISGFRE